MDNDHSLSHTKWDCQYHFVWIPKSRKKKLFPALRQELGSVFHDLARRKECRIIEGHLLINHVHMLLSVPPKYAVSNVNDDMIRFFLSPSRKIRHVILRLLREKKLYRIECEHFVFLHDKAART